MHWLETRLGPDESAQLVEARRGVHLRNDPNRARSGLIGVQVHFGPPMRVEYRNWRLRDSRTLVPIFPRPVRWRLPEV